MCVASRVPHGSEKRHSIGAVRWSWPLAHSSDILLLIWMLSSLLPLPFLLDLSVTLDPSHLFRMAFSHFHHAACLQRLQILMSKAF